MKILITGATGLVGSKLLEELVLKGYDDLRILTTNKKKARTVIPFPVEIFEWNPMANTIERNSLNNVDIVLNLAGDNIADGRWNNDKKNKILKSRVNGTKLLLNEIKNENKKPIKFINSSAIGIYGDTESIDVDENHKHANDFLANVCSEWEDALFSQKIEGMKAFAIRTGIVLSSEGGALSKMLPPFLMGAGGNIGNGKQYMSWIHIDDLVSQIIFLIENETKFNIYNGVSPKASTNAEFTKTLGSVLRRPTLVPVPAFALKTFLGEMSTLLTNGQKVIPTNFLKEGFKFKYPDLKTALENILELTNNGEKKLTKYQWVKKDVKDIFHFFTDEKNLEKITPSYLNFKVVGKNTSAIKTGTIIDYKLKIHGVQVKWKTKINSFVENKTFIDEQIKGPYEKWVHQHDFIAYKNGTLLRDHVVYKIPMGPIGNIAAGYLIKKDVENIFKYRKDYIANHF